ncbi:MAG: minichromosome maintenance protein MCM [Candidatus Aenigmarchaeota archaeon]|nr:minichromosome maintenance protein MCM [Candidatus Aenigmarchaeota archaeon]
MELKEQIYDFIRAEYYDPLVFASTHGKPLVVNFADLDKFAPEIGEKLLESPEEYIALFGEVVEDFDLPRLPAIQFRNLPKSQEVTLKNMKMKHLGKFLTLRGYISEVSEIHIRITKTIHECANCGNLFEQKQLRERLEYAPCPICKNLKDIPIKDNKKTNQFRIIISDPETKQKLELRFNEPLSNPEVHSRMKAGNSLRVNGILMELKRLPEDNLYQPNLVFEVNSIEGEETEPAVVKNPKQYEHFQELSKTPNFFEKLSERIMPCARDYKELAEALLLLSFGGITKQSKDGNILQGNIKILIVGNPGTGKTSLLKNIQSNLPKTYEIPLIATTNAIGKKFEEEKPWTVIFDEFQQDKKLRELLEFTMGYEGNFGVIVCAYPRRGVISDYVSLDEQLIFKDLAPLFDLIFIKRELKVNDTSTPPEQEDMLKKEKLEEYLRYSKTNIRILEFTEERQKQLGAFCEGLSKKIPLQEYLTPEWLNPLRITETLHKLSEASARARLSCKVEEEDTRRAIRIVNAYLRDLRFNFEAKAPEPVASESRSNLSKLFDLIKSLEKNDPGKEVSLEELSKKANESNIENLEKLIKRLSDEGLIFGYPLTKKDHIRLL